MNPRKDTYEYRKPFNKVDVDIDVVNISTCTKKVLLHDLSKPSNGKFYHTSDTNEFFFDWGNKRYQLNVFGSGVDFSVFAKKEEIPTKLSQLKNDSGYIKMNDLNSLFDRVKELERTINNRDNGDIVIDSNPVTVGTGIRIDKDNCDTISEYVNASNTIKSGKTYTSKGINSVGVIEKDVEYAVVKNPTTGVEYKMFSYGDDWIEGDFNSDGVKEKISKGTFVDFGGDIDFIGWDITYKYNGDDELETKVFVPSDYEVLDIYSENEIPSVFVYSNGNEYKLSSKMTNIESEQSYWDAFEQE